MSIRISPVVLSGGSPPAREARVAFEQAVRTAGPILIVAEPGLRVDEVAAAIHTPSRPGTPLVTVDCAVADVATLEADLLGHGPPHGSREDVAVVSTSSALIRAGAGTLYLQNVVELPAGVQRRLARILRDGEVRAGGRRQALECRVMASATPAIAAEVREGHFRPDLFRRLARVTITIPALRQRTEDIPELVQRLAAEIAAGSPVAFTRAAMTVLSAPSWTGNLDELQPAIERIVRSVPSGAIRQEDVLAHVPLDAAFVRVAPEVTLREARRQFEREYIASVLERHRWRMSDAARTLGIERANLYRKTRQLGITRRTAAPAAS